MKKIAFVICICISFAGFAQALQNPSIKISRAKFIKTKKLTGLVPPVKGCDVLSYHFSTNIGNGVKSFNVKGGNVTGTMKTIIKEVKKGERVIIDNIKSNCAEQYKRKYIFIIQ